MSTNFSFRTNNIEHSIVGRVTFLQLINWLSGNIIFKAYKILDFLDIFICSSDYFYITTWLATEYISSKMALPKPVFLSPPEILLNSYEFSTGILLPLQYRVAYDFQSDLAINLLFTHTKFFKTDEHSRQM